MSDAKAWDVLTTVRRSLRKLLVTTAWLLCNLPWLRQVIIECVALATWSVNASMNRIELENTKCGYSRYRRLECVNNYAGIPAIGPKELTELQEI